MDALVADRVTKRAVPFFLLVLEIMWANVVWNERQKQTLKHLYNYFEHNAGQILTQKK